MSKKTIVVGLSGGVDSSVAAALLKEQGHNVIGATMAIWDNNPKVKATGNACYGPDEKEDIAEAQRVCKLLDIPYHVFDLKEDYKTYVLDYFSREYKQGRTPNPCVMCNKTMKFGTLVQAIRSNGIEFDYFATGHYARVEFDNKSKRYLLKKAQDRNKDQTYFIYGLTQEQLATSMFPLGGMEKPEVKALSKKYGLGLEDKAESQNFVSGDYATVLDHTPKPGTIVDKSGRILGQHKGISLYTVGQRKGLGLAVDEPLFVLAINAKENQLIVGPLDDTYSSEYNVSNLFLSSIASLKEPTKVTAMMRYRQAETEAIIHPLDDGRARVELAAPKPAITPGQAAVFYQGNTILGGGIID
jgi:tRNA-uridine 2-sulfurtransferase